MQKNARQKYGAKDGAGMRASATLSKRRKNYRTSYGHGISRTPRKILSRRGTRMYWVGAVVPNTVGGRRAHPPKATKKLGANINKKERKKAIRSGIAASVDLELVKQRGHVIPASYPFALDQSFESLQKTKEVVAALGKLGLDKELARVEVKKVRAGKGKARGRKYAKKTGPLIIVGKACQISKSAHNIPGVDIVEVKNVNAELLAPGSTPGRLTLWTTSALDALQKNKLFL